MNLLPAFLEGFGIYVAIFYFSLLIVLTCSLFFAFLYFLIERRLNADKEEKRRGR